jgi:predicted O-methyltransferase YrrM
LDENSIWSQVDAWFAEQLQTSDNVLETVLAEIGRAGLPQISVSRNQGRLLQLLVTATGARRMLEIGTLGGYSTICLARGLPVDGRLITLEINPAAADLARANLALAGVDQLVEIRLGDARDTLAAMATEELPPFDLVFIDANKDGYPEYFDAALGLTRPGGLILADNVVRRGAVIDPDSDDAAVQGVRRMITDIAAKGNVTATTVQTVGEKGYDGLLIARVNV